MTELSVSFLGHATALIRDDSTTILSDPHLYATYSHELFRVTPPRVVVHDLLRKPDAVFISHRHRDHFDPKSLDLLDRSVPVMCPRDIQIVHVLERLGFADVNAVSDWDSLTVGSLNVVVTPSRYRVPEHGIIVRRDGIAVWNMVDTVVDSEIVQAARAAAGVRFGLIMWPYQPLLETEAHEGRSIDLPTKHLEAALEILRLTNTRAVVPYSDGQMGNGAADWLNHYRFPIDARQVAPMVRKVLPNAALFEPLPGTRVRVTASGSSAVEADEHAVALPRDLQDREYDKTEPMPPLSALPVPARFGETLSSSDLCRALNSRLKALLENPISKTFLNRARDLDHNYFIVVEDHGQEMVIGLAWERDEVGWQVAPRPNSWNAQRSSVVRTTAGVLRAIFAGELHFITAYLAALLRGWDGAVNTASGSAAPYEIRYETDLDQDLLSTGVMSGIRLLNAHFSQDPQLPLKLLDREIEELRAEAS